MEKLRFLHKSVSVGLLMLTWRALALDIQLPLETGTFKQDAGAEMANGQCLICHSVEYVTMQPPMPRAFWKSAVQKMQQKYGAPITDAQIDPLTDYLTRNYGVSTNTAQALTPQNATADGTKMTGEELAAKYFCLSCHRPEVKVGPPYRDVAQKYKNDPNALAHIDEQIHKGGSGKWGPVVMPGFPQISATETKVLAEWILGTK
jgi:cytochrome c551/c552